MQFWMHSVSRAAAVWCNVRYPANSASLLEMTLPQNLSAEIQLMLSPRETLGRLTQASARVSMWRRPLLLALFIGCTMSLIATRVLTLRLVFSEALGWLFVPILQAASLALIWWRARRRVAFARTLDLFFASNGPWLLWLTGIGAVAAFVSPLDAYGFTSTHGMLPIVGFAILAALWSGYIDLCLFRLIFGHTTSQAARILIVQRALVWLLGMLYALWFPLLPLVRARLGA